MMSVKNEVMILRAVSDPLGQIFRRVADAIN